MADRFPSLDDFDAGQTEARPGATTEGSFLDREREILGEDADLFTTTDDRQTAAAAVEDGDDDLLGGNDHDDRQPQISGGDEIDGFESSFPAISTQNEVSFQIPAMSCSRPLRDSLYTRNNR